MLTSYLNKERFKPLYMNRPQMMAHLIQAPFTTCVWGRGTGKTTLLHAPRMASWVQRMPRSVTVLLGSSYQQILTKTLPGIIQGWELLGLVRGRDFFVGQFAPKKWKWDKPYWCPEKAGYFIHTRFGSGIVLVSQDRPGSANGISIDAIAADEVKLLNREKYEQELLPAMRGNLHHFGHLDCHGSILLTTDMPVTAEGEWILRKQQDHVQEHVDLIFSFQYEIQRMFARINSGTLTKAQIKRMSNQIQQYERKIAVIRSGNRSKGIPKMSYFSMASSYENYDVLGEGYFETMKRTLSEFNFNTSILNMRIIRDGHSFYPELKDAEHGYTKFNNSYLEKLEYNFEKAADQSCLQDGDLAYKQPLHIGMDYGGGFNCMVVGQAHPKSIMFINAFHRDYPDKIQDVVADFRYYYRHHERKEVIFYYDHTATGTSANNPKNYMQTVIDELSKSDENGRWSVKKVYLGHTKGYDERYNSWNAICKGEMDQSFAFNRNHCQEWFEACMRAPMKDGTKGIEKVKTSERKKPGKREYNVPQVQATHYTDAGDTLLVGMLKHKPSGSSFAFRT